MHILLSVCFVFLCLRVCQILCIDISWWGLHVKMQAGLKNIKEVEIFPPTGFVWWFCQYLCRKNTFLLWIWVPRGATILVHSTNEEYNFYKGQLMILCALLLQMPTFYMTTYPHLDLAFTFGGWRFCIKVLCDDYRLCAYNYLASTSLVTDSCLRVCHRLKDMLSMALLDHQTSVVTS